MGKLKVLPAQIANMIAAGEVVQRPSSVVKELMENAVDAGAKDITVVIADSGRTLIQVIDNGCGMSPADAVLCFERHATSKIAEAADLEDILTYGFRGEALASIAAVSEVTLKTRREGDEAGEKVTIQDYNSVKSSSCSTPAGSNFEIRNLFYNTPARRKFLKSDNVEFRHIVDEFTRIAIPHPEIAFTLFHNGKELYSLKRAKSLKFRITDLLGSSVVGDVVDINTVTTSLTVNGFIGKPDSAKKTLGNQYFFVCGRYFRSPYLHKAVMNAYQEFMPEGLTPSYFIFLEIDPHSMDVNIHPTKTEIKFEEDSVIFQTLYACVKATLGHNSFGQGIDFEVSDAIELPQIGRSFEEFKGGVTAPNVDFDPSYNPFEPDAPSDYKRFVTPSENYGVLFENRTVDAPVQAQPASKVFVLKDRYVVMPCVSGLMFVSVRRAWERIQYERALAALSDGETVTQVAMFPIQIKVGVQQRLLFDENAQTLRTLGFDITPLGNDTVSVGGVPAGYSCEQGRVEAMVQDLALILSDNSSALPEIMRQRMAEKIATLGSCNVQAPSSSSEAQGLLDTLFACSNSEFTSSGRRIVCILPVEDIDKQF